MDMTGRIRLALAAAAACAMLVVPIRAQYGAPDGAPRITQQQFKRLMAQRNVIIVDTRTPEEFRLGHIPGAILLPLEGAMTWPDEYEKTAEMLQRSTRPIVTYCA